MPDDNVREFAVEIARSMDKNQGEDVIVFEVAGLTSIADYFVIATAKNIRHLKALARAAQDLAEELGMPIIGREGAPESGWILIDTGDVVVHIFDSDRRSLYNLEVIWGDAAELKL